MELEGWPLAALKLLDVSLVLSRPGGHRTLRGVPSCQEGTKQSRIRRVASKASSIQEASGGQEGAGDWVTRCQEGVNHLEGRQVASLVLNSRTTS